MIYLIRIRIFVFLTAFFLFFSGIFILFAGHVNNPSKSFSSWKKSTQDDISPKSKKLENLRVKVENHPGKVNELNYLKVFPRNFKDFYFIFYGSVPDLTGYEEGESGFSCAEKQYKTFCPNKFLFVSYENDGCCFELYEQHMKHISLLDKLSKKYPIIVLNIWLDIATNGGWDADAVGFLQEQINAYAAKHTQIFVRELNKRNIKNRLSIVKFMANIVRIRTYENYLQTMHNLHELNFLNLYELFKQVRLWRMDMPEY